MPDIACVCEIGHSLPVKAVVWMGSSREDLKEFPEAGVKEIRVRDAAGIFRMLYFATRPEGVYVLHCFQKKTQRTSRSDLELATKRFESIGR
jgi:phage-related protein